MKPRIVFFLIPIQKDVNNSLGRWSSSFLLKIICKLQMHTGEKFILSRCCSLICLREKIYSTHHWIGGVEFNRDVHVSILYCEMVNMNMLFNKAIEMIISLLFWIYYPIAYNWLLLLLFLMLQHNTYHFNATVLYSIHEQTKGQ